MARRSGRSIRRSRVLVPVLGVAALIVVVAALNPISGVSAKSTPAPARPNDAAVLKTLAVLHPHITARAADTVLASAGGRLGVFAGARSASDAMPSQLAAVLPEAVEQQQSRLVEVQGSNEVFVTPSASGVCLSDTSGSQNGCLPLSRVLEGGVAQSTECGRGLPNDETVEVAGVVPNEATQPTAILSDGTRRALEVHNNVFIADFARKQPLPTEIEVQTPSGPHVFSSTVPANAAQEDCVIPR
jgi:hypothetical protein